MTAYGRFLENVLLRAHNLAKGRHFVDHLKFLEKSQWWSRDELLDFQWRELRKLLDHAFRTVPYYREKYAAAGIALEDVRTPADFARLPILTKDEVNAHREELRSTAFRGRMVPHSTSGSSWAPTRFYITMESYDWRMAASQRVYTWAGCSLGERSVYLWGDSIGHFSRFSLLKKRAYRAVHRQVYYHTKVQSRELWDRIYRRIIAFRPSVLVGYVSSLEEFARYLLEEGKRVPSVTGVIAGAEVVYDDTRKLVKEAIGAPLFNTYGSREFMSIAGECALHDGLHINCENVLVETARPASEGPSDLVITDLHNYGMPFLRYAIGDIGLLQERPCPCGRGLPCLQSIEGRVSDSLRTIDGRVVSGIWFSGLAIGIPEFREYQVRQERLDKVVISAVLTRPLSDASQRLLDREVRKAFGEATEVQLDVVDCIPKLASGKRRRVIGLERGG